MANNATTKKELEAQNAELKAQMEEQQKQMEMLRTMMAALGLDPTANQQKKPATDNKKKDVTITNLTEGKLILKTLEGRYISLDGEFAARKVTREMCRSIVEAMPRAYLEGCFMLCGNGMDEIADLFTENELKKLKNDILSPKQIKDIFTNELSQIEGIYNRATPSQKETINGILRRKIETGETVDIRIKELMTNLTGIDFLNMQKLDEEMLEIIRQHGGKV